MKKVLYYAVLTGLLVVTFEFLSGLCADDEGHSKRHRHRGGSHDGVDEKQGRNSKTRLAPVTNETYKEVCGTCHCAYQPGLLPSGSWEKLLSNLKDHFGETVDIDAESRGVIENYLIENAAERSQVKWSRKIVRCLKGDIPLRITEIPYIRRKHRNIPPDVFTQKTVGSLSNCSACHMKADQGIYEEHSVTIPK